MDTLLKPLLLMPWPDWLALVLFFAGWSGYAHWARQRAQLRPSILAALLFMVFQAVFAWAEAPMGWIEAATEWASGLLSSHVPAGLLRSLLVDGVVAGAAGVVVFLPQIVILFFFILVLEE